MHRARSLATSLIAAVAVATAPLAAQTCPVELQTIFAADNGGAVGGTVYFDLVVANPVSISALSVNTSVAASLPIGLTVYTNASVNTFAGNETDPNWTQVAIDDGTAVSAGLDSPSRCPLLAPVTLQPGTYPMALVGSNGTGSFNHRYTNGNGGNQEYTDANLTIQTGSATNVPFTATVFTPRVWNGTIEYGITDALFADFTAAFTNCVVPVTATFTDTSCTTDASGITSWTWDFGDGNGSNLQNPVHSYTQPGLYTVSLTVTDTSHPPSTRTLPDLVSVAFPNDECATAILVEPGRQGPFGNPCATDSLPAMPCGVSGIPGDNDVWFRYVHTGPDATVRASTCGSFTDTKMEVLLGSCGALASIGCNDDACSLQSRVSWGAFRGATYYVRVGGYSGARGAFDLEIEITGAFRLLGLGCGGTSLRASSDGRLGLPQIGSTVTFNLMSPAIGAAQVIWIGQALPAPVPLCAGCIQFCDMSLSCAPGSVCTVTIPNDPGLCGGALCVQGASVFAPPGPGCTFGAFSFTMSDAIQVVIGC